LVFSDSEGIEVGFIQHSFINGLGNSIVNQLTKKKKKKRNQQKCPILKKKKEWKKKENKEFLN
jgi:hypothetical protein